MSGGVWVPVEHVPVWLDEDPHEEGVVGAGCNVGATGGWVPGVKVIRHPGHCCVTEPASASAGSAQASIA